jgi:phosphoribosyl 1,2-cyclic phosphate phosphodiesterase
LNTISNEPFDVMGVPFQPIEVLHHKLPVLGFRVHDFVYITDANYIAPEEKEKIKGAKVLVINALRREHHISHFTLSDAVALVEELQPEQAYFTHISHQLGRHVDVNAELPGNVSCAYDGLKITL